MIKKAMILAAGFGKRILPLTIDCPKPLLKIGNETLLSNTLKFLENFGIKEVVINTHYLSEKIIDYINNNNFNMTINIVEEKEKILDTGGGIMNCLHHFSDETFLVINPDTIWNLNYLKELQKMEKFFSSNAKHKCLLLVVKRLKSFDKSFKGDFNLINNLISRNNRNDLNYIFTGLQIIKPEVFSTEDVGVFSINKVWDQLIENKELYGIESEINFNHVSTLNIYKTLLEKNFKH